MTGAYKAWPPFFNSYMDWFGQKCRPLDIRVRVRVRYYAVNRWPRLYLQTDVQKLVRKAVELTPAEKEGLMYEKN